MRILRPNYPSTQKPHWCVEVKWTDRPAKDSKQIRHVIAFAKEHKFANSARRRHAAMVTTKTVHELRTFDDVSVAFVPTSLYAYVLGKNLLARLHAADDADQDTPELANRHSFMKAKPYPKTKPSGVEWLGDVPAHWKVKRLKMAAQLTDKKVEADQENPG